MTKLTRFEDIPQFTRTGHWECDFGLDGVVEFVAKYASQGLDLDPDFQRGHVWTEAQQIAWLEFWARGGTTGRVLYFNCPHWGRGERDDFVIVDGKQRLQAITRFVANEIPIYGSLYREFTDSPRRMTHTVKINVNDLKTRAEVLEWYIQMNSGGVVHSETEIQRVKELLAGEIA